MFFAQVSKHSTNLAQQQLFSKSLSRTASHSLPFFIEEAKAHSLLFFIEEVGPWPLAFFIEEVGA